MGNMQQIEWAEGVQEGVWSLRQAVSASLEGNHYPPVPQEYVSPVLEAITAVNEGRHGDDIDLSAVESTGMVPVLAHDVGGTLMISAIDLVQITHSWPFCDREDD